MLHECLECCRYLRKVQNSGTKTARWNLSRRRSGGVRAFTGTEATIHLFGFFSTQTWSIYFHLWFYFINCQSSSHHTHTHTPLCVRVFVSSMQTRGEHGISLLWGSCGFVTVLHIPSHLLCINLFIKRTANTGCWYWQDSGRSMKKHKLQLSANDYRLAKHIKVRWTLSSLKWDRRIDSCRLASLAWTDNSGQS